MLLIFVGLCWNSHVGHLEARQQHYPAVCGLLLPERHHHSLRPGVRLTPEFILLHLPGVIATCSLPFSRCQIMFGCWVLCHANFLDELLLKITYLGKQYCFVKLLSRFFSEHNVFIIDFQIILGWLIIVRRRQFQLIYHGFCT